MDPWTLHGHNSYIEVSIKNISKQKMKRPSKLISLVEFKSYLIHISWVLMYWSQITNLISHHFFFIIWNLDLEMENANPF